MTGDDPNKIISDNNAAATASQERANAYIDRGKPVPKGGKKSRRVKSRKVRRVKTRKTRVNRRRKTSRK